MSAVSPAAEALGAPAPAVSIGLEADALEHRYGTRLGLAAVSFRWRGPGVIAVTGPNGSGKSTLLRILAGLLRPSTGTVRLRLDDRDIVPAERRAQIGYAGPELAFYEELTVGENLAFAAECAGLRSPRAEVAAALARVGLAEWAADRVSALSSGMRQRLRLAFARLRAPRLLLLDEPGSHLDESGRERLAASIADAARSALVVLATNDDREWRWAGERFELRGRDLGRRS